jgi:Tol biopolymer transport system component
MAETTEVFEMITRTRPDDGALDRQHHRQQRRRRNERAVVFALAAVLVAGSAVGIIAARQTAQPASSPTPTVATSTGPFLEGLDASTGAVVATLATDVAPYRSDVSPDGTLIAFVKPADFGHGQIFVMRLDGTHERQLTGLQGQRGCGCGAIDPAWSPDGTTIAYSGMNLRGGRDIYLVNVTDGSIEQVTHSPLAGESEPTWSPDGRSIAFERGVPRHGCCGSETTGSIVVMRLGNGRTGVIARMDDAGAPSWSPVGRWIVFNGAGGTSGTNGLWLVRPDGTQLHPLLRETEDDTTPAWSPDGSRIAFDRGQSVAIMDVASGAVRNVGPITDPAWSADGRTLYGWHT